MLRIFIAAALTIVGPLLLLAACYAVSYIPFVKRMLDVDENDPLFIRVATGFMAIATFITMPACIMTLLIVLFNAFYGIL